MVDGTMSDRRFPADRPSVIDHAGRNSILSPDKSELFDLKFEIRDS
jgi:hypothetical protein